MLTGRWPWQEEAEELQKSAVLPRQSPGDTTPCRMTGVTLHSHVRCKEREPFRQKSPTTLDYRGTSLI